jgi:hypothetical protein
MSKNNIYVICNIYSKSNRHKSLLPHFVKHYAELGVDYIFFICETKTKEYIDSLKLHLNKIKYEIIDDGSMSDPIGRVGYNDSIRINNLKNQIDCAGAYWYIPADIDEFHEIKPFGSFKELQTSCENEGVHFVKSNMVDRIAIESILPKNIDLAIPINKQFPIKKNITKDTMQAYDFKCIFLNAQVDIREGHHSVHNPDNWKHYSKTFTTNHYKWFGDVLEIEQFKMEQRKTTGLDYYKEIERLLKDNQFKKRQKLIFTIVDKSHKKEAYFCLKSAMKYNEDCDFNAIVLEENSSYDINFKDINFQTLESKNDKLNKDSLRWSLKTPMILKFLEQYEKVIYVDSDIYFTSHWDFLFDEIDGVLLTKHHRSLEPGGHEYQCNFTDGFFNAGFIGASKLGINAINWLKRAVEWKCEKNPSEGLWDDQKYLDIMSLEFNDIVKTCRHKGCNVANWNSKVIKTECDGKKWFVKSDKSEVVFLHLSNSSYRSQEPILKHHTEKLLKRRGRYDRFNSLFT